MDSASSITGFGFSFGYVDEYGLDIALGSGPRTYNDALNNITINGTMGPNDTCILGSGTKGYTAANVMRLVDRGLVNLEDPAGQHIDPSLQAQFNTTLEGLYGDWANLVTVRMLIFMQSGIQDFEASF